MCLVFSFFSASAHKSCECVYTYRVEKSIKCGNFSLYDCRFTIFIDRVSVIVVIVEAIGPLGKFMVKIE